MNLFFSLSLEACALARDLLRMFFPPFYDLHKNLLSIPFQTAVQRQKIIPVLIFLLGLLRSHPFQPQSLVSILRLPLSGPVFIHVVVNCASLL